MSRAARWVLGVFSAAFGLMLLLSEWTAPSQAPAVAYLMAAFCAAISIACFSAALRNPALRLIGAMVFVATASYLIDELLRAPARAYSGTSEPHWVNAVFALLVFGLPGLAIALHRTRRSRRSAPKEFRGEPVPPSSEAESQ